MDDPATITSPEALEAPQSSEPKQVQKNGIDDSLEDIVSEEDNAEDLSDVMSDLDGLEEHQVSSQVGECGSKRKAQDSNRSEEDKRIRMTESGGATANSELGTVVRMRNNGSGDEWACADCNAIFVKYVDAKTHARSPNHLSVIEGRLPKFHGSWSAGTHSCLLCWFAFSTRDELASHYQSPRHQSQLEKLGVVRMYDNEIPQRVSVFQRLAKKTEQQPDSKCDSAASSTNGETSTMIVLDEVKGSSSSSSGSERDGGSTHGSDCGLEVKSVSDSNLPGGAAMSPPRSRVHEEVGSVPLLDEVSSDEEQLENVRPPVQKSARARSTSPRPPAAAHTGCATAVMADPDLEDVDSSDDEAAHVPPDDGKQDGLEDVSDCEDIGQEEVNKRMPSAPPPPVISSPEHQSGTNSHHPWKLEHMELMETLQPVPAAVVRSKTVDSSK